jgi:hypothetical protein
LNTVYVFPFSIFFLAERKNTPRTGTHVEERGGVTNKAITTGQRPKMLLAFYRNVNKYVITNK